MNGMKANSHFAILMAAIVLGACADMKPYVLPADVPTAKLSSYLIRGGSRWYDEVVVRGTPTCNNYKLFGVIGPDTNELEEFRLLLGDGKAGPKSAMVPAGIPLGIKYYERKPDVVRSWRWLVVLQPGHSYSINRLSRDVGPSLVDEKAGEQPVFLEPDGLHKLLSCTEKEKP